MDVERVVSGNGIPSLCPFVDALDSSDSTGYKDVSMEYVPFSWCGSGSDCLWIYCQSGMALVFLVIALVGAVGLWFALRDTPRSVGLPELNSKKGVEEKEDTSAEFKQFVRKNVFGNPAIWVLAIANFFVYIVRYAVLDWGPTLLGEWKGVSIHHAGWMVAAFEISGIVGMLVAGWATDRFFGGRGPRVCVICMALATVFVALFWGISQPPMWLATLLLGAAGFCIYGPQALVGIAAANIATKKAAATAVGFTGLFGYASTLVSGWGLGLLAQHYGWNIAVGALILIAIMGTLIFMAAWSAKANGYDND